MSPIMRDPDLPPDAQAALDAADQAMEKAWMAYAVVGTDLREGEKGGYHTKVQSGHPLQLVEMGLGLIGSAMEQLERNEGEAAVIHYANEIIREIRRVYLEEGEAPEDLPSPS